MESRERQYVIVLLEFVVEHLVNLLANRLNTHEMKKKKSHLALTNLSKMAEKSNSHLAVFFNEKYLMSSNLICLMCFPS